ncbi:MAG TPA: DUF2867 domain-containing protein [Polyangiaceae bacterium]|nr:DUF2867 domain-containing protein [Polyangiaceae bacterium]
MRPDFDAPELQTRLAGADHVDEKIVEGAVTLREFVSGAMASEPGWVKFLFRVRGWLARVMGLEHPESMTASIRPEDIPFVRGGKVGFFTVAYAEEDRCIVLEATDTHLTGYLAVIAEPAADGRRRFRAVTIVKYHRWTGPLYFNLIRPFHHLVVHSMIHAAVRRAAPAI